MQHLRYSQFFRTMIMATDWALILLLVWIFNPDTRLWQRKELVTMGILFFLWQLISDRTRLYSIPRMITFTVFLERILRQIIIFCACVFLISLISRDSFNISSEGIFLWFLSTFIILKSMLFFIIKWARRHGYNHRNIMFLDGGEASEILRHILVKRDDYGFKIFDFKAEPTLENLKKFWSENGIHSIYLPLSDNSGLLNFKEITLLAERQRVHINFVPDVFSEEFATYELGYAQTQPVLQRGHYPLEYRSNAVLKRLLDIFSALLFLVFIASWLFPVLAVLIKKDSQGTVFFKQRRYGYRDRIFNCYKFRTMVPNSLSEAATTEKNDRRITNFGKFLRKSSLDELPQFWNVLLGDMSLVGPRPHMVSVDDHYREFINHYSVRNTVKPGLTGLAQIEGLRGDRGDMAVEMQKRVLADAFYVKNWSLGMDFIICIKTFIILLRGDKNAF